MGSLPFSELKTYTILSCQIVIKRERKREGEREGERRR